MIPDALAPSLCALPRRWAVERLCTVEATWVRRFTTRVGIHPAEDERRLLRAGQRIARAMTQEERASPQTVPPYHNARHAQEALLAFEVLHEATTLPYRLWGALAMLGHDWGHTGAHPTLPVGALEAESAHRLAQACRGEGLEDPALLRALTDWVVHTEPSEGPAYNAARAQASPEDSLGAVALLINDADVLASLLPWTGPERGVWLAEEWRRAGSPSADRVGTWGGRLAFLKQTPVQSPAATFLGVAALRAAEIRTLEALDAAVLATPVDPVSERATEILMKTLEQVSGVPA
jgi:hypothetical protein